MKKLVLESSVILKWLNQKHEDNIEQADKILNDVQIGKVLLYAPEAAKYEIGKILLVGKRLTQTESKIPLMVLFNLPIEFIPHSPELLKRSYVIASAYGIDIFESSFLALAEQKGATLITENVNDEVSDLGLKIVALEDY